MAEHYETEVNVAWEKSGMKILIIYYSHTGNNAVLAEEVAGKLKADSFRLLEKNKRSEKKIIFDMIFHKKAALKALPEKVDTYDLILFMGPVWMFHLSSPLKTCIKQIRRQVGKYAFVSVSGGALGPNVKVIGELKRLLGKNLSLFLDLQVAQFCTVSGVADTAESSGYKLQDHRDELDTLTGIITTAVAGLNRRVISP